MVMFLIADSDFREVRRRKLCDLVTTSHGLVSSFGLGVSVTLNTMMRVRNQRHLHSTLQQLHSRGNGANRSQRRCPCLERKAGTRIADMTCMQMTALTGANT